jgi:hypothetical protein
MYILASILVVVGIPLFFAGVASDVTVTGALISSLGIGCLWCSYVLAIRAEHLCQWFRRWW